MSEEGFCPVPHKQRDQVWLALGAGLGCGLTFWLCHRAAQAHPRPRPRLSSRSSDDDLACHLDRALALLQQAAGRPSPRLSPRVCRLLQELGEAGAAEAGVPEGGSGGSGGSGTGNISKTRTSTMDTDTVDVDESKLEEYLHGLPEARDWAPPPLWPPSIGYLPGFTDLCSGPGSPFRLQAVPEDHPAAGMPLPGPMSGEEKAVGQLGLYARRGLPKGFLFGPYMGAVVPTPEASNHYAFKLGDGLSVCALRQGNCTRYLNDYRNTGRDQNVDACAMGPDLVLFRLTRDLAAGEEALVNYGHYYWKYFDINGDDD